MKTIVTSNTLSGKNRKSIDGAPAPDSVLLIPREETGWIQYTEEAIDVIPSLDRGEIQDVQWNFDETNAAYDIVRASRRPREYLMWIAREWCDDVTEAIEAETCTRLMTPNIEALPPRAIEYAVQQDTHVIGFNEGLTIRGDSVFDVLSDEQRRALGIDAEADSDDTDINAESHEQGDTREERDGDGTGTTESELDTEPDTEDDQRQDPDKDSVDELSGEELLAGIDWDAGRPPIGCTSEAGTLKPDDNYTDVRDALRRVARGEMSQSAAAERLDCTRKTVANALQRPHLYGVDPEQV
ncbi:helix-turn-helix domain-containing protein [Halopenitus persicus]|nr:helix-turn-helix domain-containing protein [Halopenitus persicus]